jgi:ABC-type phosphate transport system permease subunit
MDNIFLVAGIISVIFFIAKFLEMQYIEKESKPLKVLIRDTLVVYVSVVFGFFIVEQLSPVIKDTSSNISPIAFTDNPPF